MFAGVESRKDVLWVVPDALLERPARTVSEVLYYHLTEKTLEAVLPALVEKSLGRGWPVVVQAGSQERVEALDALLWTFREDSFLPHGAVKDGFESDQPVWLTVDNDTPNDAKIRFLVDGAQIDDPSPYERVVYLFDGHDNSAVESARQRWKLDKKAGHDLTYWQQSPSGGWEKKA